MSIHITVNTILVPIPKPQGSVFGHSVLSKDKVVAHALVHVVFEPILTLPRIYFRFHDGVLPEIPSWY
jgi:hypothetical protein